MPRYKVRAPDGRTFYVNAPEGATREQALAYAQKHMPKAKPAPKSRGALGWIGDNVLSPLNEAAIGMVEGAYNAASAVTDPVAQWALGMSDEEMQTVKRQRRSVSDAVTERFVSRRAPVARDVGRIAAGAAMPLPGKKLQEGGRLARTTYRAMQGAVGGAAAREVDQDAANPAAIGAAANVVVPPAVARLARSRPAQAAGKAIARYAAPAVAAADDLAQRVISRFGGRPASVRAAPVPVAPAAPATPLGPLGREAEVRAANFKRVGVDEPTTGMVTRDPAAFSFEQNIAKVDDVGADLRQQLVNIEESLAAKGNELVRSAGGAKGPELTGKGVQEALDTKRAEMQAVTGRIYEKVREERGDDVVGELGGLRELMDSPDMLDNAVFDQMRDSLGRRLSRLGGRDAMDDLPGNPTVTIRQAEDLRKFIGGLGSTADPSVRMMRGRLIDALDDDVVEAVGDDAFKAARESAKARFAEFKKTFAGKIADEGIAPEALTKKVLSDTTRLSDLRDMRKSLLTGTDEQQARGLEAWKGLRGQALGDFIARNMDANGNLIGAKITKDFATQAPKFRELLDPADYKMLRRLVKATKDAKVAPTQSSVNYSGTGPFMANMFPSMNQATRQGWKRLLVNSGAHATAFATTGPLGNLALLTGSAIIKDAAKMKAANALLRRVQLAKNPEEAAAAIKAMQEAAKTDPAVKKLLDQLGPAIGGTAAAAEAE